MNPDYPSSAIQSPVGAALGAAHGLLITRLGLQPFIVTLCGLLLYGGLARFIADDEPKGFGDAAGFQTLQRLATGSVLHVPTPFVALAIASVVGLDVPGDDREHAITT